MPRDLFKTKGIDYLPEPVQGDRNGPTLDDLLSSQTANENPPRDLFAAKGIKPPPTRASRPKTSGYEQLTSGFNEGLASVVDPAARLAEGLVIEPAQSLARLLTTGEADYNTDIWTRPGSSSLAQAINQNTVTNVPPQNKFQRMVRSGGKLAGEAAPISGGMIAGGMNRAANMITNKVIPSGTSAVGNLLDDAALAIQKSPLGAFLGEGGAAVTAGMAGQAVEEAGGDRFYGELAGGVVPSVIGRNVLDVGKAGVNTAKALLPSNLRMGQEKRAAETVAKTIGGSMDSTAGTSLEIADQLQKEIGPEFNPTLAQRTKSEALRNQQQKIERKMAGGDLEARVADYRQSEQAVNKYIQRVAPEGSADPVYVVEAAKGRIEGDMSRLGRSMDNLQSQKERLESGLPRIDRAVEGQRQRNMLDSAKDVKRDEMNQLARSLGISDAENIVNFGSFRNRIKDNEAIIPKSPLADKANIPDAVRDVLNLQTNKPLTFQDMKALRERVSDDLIDAMRSTTGSQKKVRALTALKAEIDTFLDETFENTPLANNYRQFRERYLTDYVQPFEQGAALKARGKDASGTYRVADEEAASAFWGAGDISAARQYKQIFGDQASENIRPVVLDSLRDYTSRDGVIDPRRLQEWTRKHATVLDEFPDIKKQVGNIQNTAQELLRRQAQLEGRKRAIEDSALNTVVGRLRRVGADGQDVIDSAIKDPRVMKQLVTATKKSPAARASLRRNVWEKVAGGNSKQIAEFVEKNNKSLRQIFGSIHLQNIKKIQEAKSMMEFVPSPKGMAEETNLRNMAKKEFGMNISEMTGSYIAVQRGRSNKLTEVSKSLAGLLVGRNQRDIDALFELALYDPKVANMLISKQSLKPGGGYKDAVKKYVQNRLFRIGMGVAIRSTASGENNQQNQSMR